MQALPETEPSFAMRRGASALLLSLSEWTDLRAAWQAPDKALEPDIPCAPEDVYPEDHGMVYHPDMTEALSSVP